MTLIKFIFTNIINILNMNLNIFGYDFSLTTIIIYVSLGGVILSLIYQLWDI